jgi:hypothetical protein
MFLAAFIFSSVVYALPETASVVSWLETVYVDPKRYTIPAEGLVLLNTTEGTARVYHPTKEFDTLEFKEGVMHSFGNNTLIQRSGNPQFISHQSRWR